MKKYHPLLKKMSEILDLSEQHLWSKRLKAELEKSLSPEITRLNISSCHIDAECCNLLCDFIKDENTKLLSLDISGTRLTIADASKIFEAIKNTTIIELYADNLTLKEESIQKLAESLADNSNIKFLSISGSDMNHQCVGLIANVLPNAQNLKYLRLESNSMYNAGCSAIAANLLQSNLISLEIADNMIWEDGMGNLLNALADERSQIQYLDISYNCVNLSQLVQNLRKMPNLKSLAISGCKVEEKYVLEFFNALPETNLETLIIDGLNYDFLPVSWPKVQDTVLSNADTFEVFLLALKKSRTLSDVRIGSISFDQIKKLYLHLSDSMKEQNREMTLTIQDFMKSGDFVVIHFPSFVIDCPDRDIIIRSNLRDVETDSFGFVLAAMNSPNGTINNLEIDLKEEKVNDCKGIENALGSLGKTQVEILTITFNSYSSFTLNGLQKAISDGAPIRELVLNESRFTEDEFASFFTFLSNTPNSIKNITIGFKSPRDNDVDFHQCMTATQAFLNKPDLEEVYLEGTISAKDALLVVESLKTNTNISVIDIQSSLQEHYKSPDPPLSPDAIKAYRDVAVALAEAMNSGSNLSTFSYIMLTEIFLDDTETLSAWNIAKLRIIENAKSKGESTV